MTLGGFVGTECFCPGDRRPAGACLVEALQDRHSLEHAGGFRRDGDVAVEREPAGSVRPALLVSPLVGPIPVEVTAAVGPPGGIRADGVPVPAPAGPAQQGCSVETVTPAGPALGTARSGVRKPLERARTVRDERNA